MKTRNEKILLAILLLVVFVAANYYGYGWLSQAQRNLDIKYAKLRADKAEAEVDLQKQALWAERARWIEKNEPTLTDEGDAKAEVLQEVLKGARDQNLEVLEQTLNDVQHGPGGTEISVQVKVRGSMEGLCQWLTKLQKPASFYTVSQISIKADQDQKSMVCTLQVARFFRPTS